MSQERDQVVVQGTVKYPLSLAFVTDGHRMTARLANTVESADGLRTVQFTGDRAETAYRLLSVGSRIEASGSWDKSDQHVEVDRFDVEGTDPHPYSLTAQSSADRVSATDQADKPGPPSGERTDRPPPAAPLPEPEAEAAEAVRETRPPSTGTERQNLPATEPREHQSGTTELRDSDRQRERVPFHEGQRVIALDRGNIGTVVRARANGKVMVRFRSASGGVAYRDFRVTELSAMAAERTAAPSKDARQAEIPVAHQPETEAPQPIPEASSQPGQPAPAPPGDGHQRLRVHTRRPDPQTGAILL